MLQDYVSIYLYIFLSLSLHLSIYYLINARSWSFFHGCFHGSKKHSIFPFKHRKAQLHSHKSTKSTRVGWKHGLVPGINTNKVSFFNAVWYFNSLWTQIFLLYYEADAISVIQLLFLCHFKPRTKNVTCHTNSGIKSHFGWFPKSHIFRILVQ